jgi:hypothetical protein
MANEPLLVDESLFNSRLSFKPLLTAIKKMVEAGNPGSRKLYGDLIAQSESHPEIMEAIEDMGLLQTHSELVEMLLATIFPPATSDAECLYAVSLPFKFKTIYSSKLFQELFLPHGGDEIIIPSEQIGKHLNSEKLLFAYNLILRKFLNYKTPQTSRAVYSYLDPESGLVKYMEVHVDARFVEVRTKDDLPPQIPENVICSRTNRIMPVEELLEKLPLSNFIFEGLVIVRLTDVTSQEVISEIKNTLLNIHAFSDSTVYDQLQGHIQSLLDLKNVRIGITPFFKVNGHYVYSQVHNSNSLLFKHFMAVSEKDNVNDCCQQIFYRTDRPIVFETLDKETLHEIDYLKFYYEMGARSLIMSPLKQDNELFGMLEIISEEPGLLKNSHISKIEDAIPLFTLALKKSAESLYTEIDQVIKKQFTAVQPVVEWKFTEVALNYIVGKQEQEDIMIDRIAFEEVFPLYGAIDIRNSSVERSHAIQLDLIEQLHAARHIMQKAQKEMHFPLLQEIEFKIDKYINSATDSLLSDEEIIIHDFLQGQVVSIFNHLSGTLPSIKKDIDHYFSTLDPLVGMIYHHRKEFDHSMSKINDTIVKFIDKEQASAQQVFPHYFERYVTDGVDFNIYIGHSIAPKRKFDELYLRNLKMWQLTVLAKAAKLTHHLEKTLKHPLKTTQLILAHSMPISISFRTAERKFDVDGAYNIRYEIIKKRIDKVRIKDTNERLTQPGKIAIVYSQSKELPEYLEYIEFLQNRKLIKSGVEQFDLEELQGVLGLKALRVEVDIEEFSKQDTSRELSDVTTGDLLRN